MSDQYTPTTADAQGYYAAGRAAERRRTTGANGIDLTPYSHEFDRWLEKVWMDAAEAGYAHHEDTLRAAVLRAEESATRLRGAALAALIPVWVLRIGSRTIHRIQAEAWDEGHEAGQINEHEHRPGRQMTNPYTAADTQGIPNYYEEG